MANLPEKKKAQTAEHSNGRSKGLNTTPVYNQGAKVNLGPKRKKINSKRRKDFIVRFSYQDIYGQDREERLVGQRAKMLVFMWRQRNGFTQASTPTGVTAKEYVFRFTNCEKTKLGMDVKRETLQGLIGPYVRYTLTTPLTWLAEEGFPEIRGHITHQKG